MKFFPLLFHTNVLSSFFPLFIFKYFKSVHISILFFYINLFSFSIGQIFFCAAHVFGPTICF
ncbi:unnamed protein product [Meloidogyne enterolobii]|uniref:Uncharacterized protein n=1 Tax=Meloidogyne enterolobii TaxID=390850 RepID=A0ACB0XYE9_MELEN